MAGRLPIPVSAGESFTTTHQFAELLKTNTVHILQPDPSNLGGILRTRMVCAMADANYAVVAPHQAQGPIATAVCVQIGACTPNLLVQELFDEFNVDWESQIVDNPAQVVDGYIGFSELPGLGIESSRPVNSRWPRISSRMSVSATTDASRGSRDSSASSPK